MTRASTEVKWGQIYISKETPTHHYTHVCLLRAPTHSCLPTSSLPSAIFPPVIQTYSRLQVWIWGVNWRWSHGNHVYHPGEGALRGTRVGLIPIHPVLQPDGQGTIRPSCLPLSLHGDLWPYFCDCRSLSPLCLRSVIIYNIYSHWFKRWPLSSPTLLSWLTKTLKCSSGVNPGKANTTWRGKEADYTHFQLTFWLRPRVDEQKNSSEWGDKVKLVPVVLNV